MIFAKVDVSLTRHHRVLRIPKPVRAAALGVWLAALCYTREAQLDGFCPLEALDGFATEQVIDELVRVGLFSRHEQDGAHGVLLFRYSEHNDCKRDIDRRLRDDRLRKRPTRARVERKPNGVQPDSVSVPDGIRSESDVPPVGFPAQGIPDSDSDSDSDSGSQIRNGDPEAKAAPPRERPRSPNGHGDGTFGFATAAWVEGVAQGTGKPFTRPSPGEISKLVDAIVAHAPRDPGEREVWARTSGFAYGAATAGHRAPSVWGFAAWLDGGRLPIGRAAPAPEPAERPYTTMSPPVKPVRLTQAQIDEHVRLTTPQAPEAPRGT